MRNFISLSAAAGLIALAIFAQAPGAAQQAKGPKNLKILQPENFRASMDVFTQALGVNCQYCHVAGNFESDDKPQKNTARMMLTMSRELNEKFGDGKAHVRCYTCHQGSAQPLMAPPAK